MGEQDFKVTTLTSKLTNSGPTLNVSVKAMRTRKEKKNINLTLIFGTQDGAEKEKKKHLIPRSALKIKAAWL